MNQMHLGQVKNFSQRRKVCKVLCFNSLQLHLDVKIISSGPIMSRSSYEKISFDHRTDLILVTCNKRSGTEAAAAFSHQSENSVDCKRDLRTKHRVDHPKAGKFRHPPYSIRN